MFLLPSRLYFAYVSALLAEIRAPVLLHLMQHKQKTVPLSPLDPSLMQTATVVTQEQRKQLSGKDS